MDCACIVGCLDGRKGEDDDDDDEDDDNPCCCDDDDVEVDNLAPPVVWTYPPPFVVRL